MIHHSLGLPATCSLHCTQSHTLQMIQPQMFLQNKRIPGREKFKIQPNRSKGIDTLVQSPLMKSCELQVQEPMVLFPCSQTNVAEEPSGSSIISCHGSILLAWVKSTKPMSRMTFNMMISGCNCDLGFTTSLLVLYMKQ